MRGRNKELYDGRTIEVDGLSCKLYEVTIPDTEKAQDFYAEKKTVYTYIIPHGPATFYEVFSSRGDYIGRVSPSIRCDRV